MCNKMSHVRLSNASPTVERVDARQPDAVRTPVRRNLFGRPDREELQRYFQANVREGVRTFTETYNFDPVAHTPLPPGRFEWQEERDAAGFYSRPPHGSQRPRREEEVTEEDTRQDGSRKRRSEEPGPCPRKRSNSEEGGEDEEQPGAAVRAAAETETEEEEVVEEEETGSQPKHSADVQ